MLPCALMHMEFEYLYCIIVFFYVTSYEFNVFLFISMSFEKVSHCLDHWACPLCL